MGRKITINLKIIGAGLLISCFISVVAIILIAVVTPDLKPALDTDRAMQMIQSSTNLQELGQIAASQTEKLEDVRESCEKITGFACLALFVSAFCSGICLCFIWRLRA